MAHTMRGFMVMCLARHSGERTSQARSTRQTQRSSQASMAVAGVISPFNGVKGDRQVLYREPSSILLPIWCTLLVAFLAPTAIHKFSPVATFQFAPATSSLIISAPPLPKASLSPSLTHCTFPHLPSIMPQECGKSKRGSA
jgi:hypothetical protein